jgi:hypothetical protein
MSQEQWILSALKRGRALTPIDALRGCRCFRLAARINDLRRQGFKIKTEILSKGGKSFARYKLNKKRG